MARVIRQAAQGADKWCMSADGSLPAAARRSRGSRRPARWRGRAFLSAVAFVLLAVAAGALTLTFKGAGERAIEGERTLQSIVSELRAQDGLEWRAISRRVKPAEIRPELAASARRVDVLTARVVRAGLPVERARRQLARQQAYLQALREELRLLDAGRFSEAVEFDEAFVDPRFEAALETLEENAQWLHDRETRARKVSDLGVLLTVLAALGGTVIIQRFLVRAEARRREEQWLGARYRALVDESSDLVMVLGADGNLHYFSPAAERFVRDLLGVDRRGLVLPDVVHPGDHDAVIAALTAARERPGVTTTVQARLGRDQVEWRHFEISVRDLSRDPSVGGIVLTCHDVTERHALQEEMTYRAFHDALTGLPNRRLLNDRIEEHLRTEGAFGTGLLLLDLDRFKEINDTLGHHVGDELLVQVGARLAAALRKSDTVGRLGGDEFAVLLPGAGTVDDARKSAESLRAALAPPFRLDGIELQVEASIGVVVSGVHGEDAVTLLRHADIAMYTAKRNGLGVCVFDPAADMAGRRRPPALPFGLRVAPDGNEA